MSLMMISLIILEFCHGNFVTTMFMYSYLYAYLFPDIERDTPLSKGLETKDVVKPEMPSPTSSADGSRPSLSDSPTRKRSMDEESEECGPNKMSKISVAFQCPYCTYSTDKKVKFLSKFEDIFPGLAF